MPFPVSIDELMCLLARHESRIRSNPTLREAVRVLARGIELALYDQDADYLQPEDAVLTVPVTANMRAAYQIILEEVAS